MSSVSKDIRSAVEDVVIAAKKVLASAAISHEDEYYWTVPDDVMAVLCDTLFHLRSLRGDK